MAKKKTTTIPSDYVQPPEFISDEALEVWLKTVTSYSPQYFSPSHQGMLYIFAEAQAATFRYRTKLVKARSADVIERLTRLVKLEEKTVETMANRLRVALSASREPALNPNRDARSSAPIVDGGGSFDWRNLPFPETKQ